MTPRRDTIGRMSTPTPSFTLLPIRTATVQDLDALDRLEQICFPPAEAASRASISSRLAVFPDHFWLLEAQHGPDGGTRLVSFVNGMVTDQPHLLDEMYDDAGMHDPQGAWQMIFGVNTLPDYRRHGYAGQLIERAIADARAQGRRGLVLTCKDRLVHYYAKFGFVSEGVSSSTHGGVVWYQMRLTF